MTISKGMLWARSDTPMLLLEDRQYDTAGKPLFLSKQIFCTKFIKLYL